MRLAILSDLHLEFHLDHGYKFIRSLYPTGVDVLALAGDITTSQFIVETLGRICDRYRDALAVVYVHGNHEFYNSERSEVVRATQEAVSACHNLIWLDCNRVVLNGQGIVGAPLWFRRVSDPMRRRLQMSDFHVIRGFEQWVYEENARARQILANEVQSGDIVITHHLPARPSVAAPFRDSPLNPWFLCDIEEAMRARAPALWVHGHTHSSCDYTLGTTRVVCNPRGYWPHDLNAQFNAAMVVEL